MKSIIGAIFILALMTLIFSPANMLGYFGLIFCFILCSLGTAKGIWNIASYVSGTSIKYPHVGAKSILGTVVCEANFLSGIITCVLAYNNLNKNNKILLHYFYFCSGLSVGICSYFSSVATGIICGAITMKDGRDPFIFYKVVVLEIIPASIGLIGFILGIILNSKADAMSI